MAKNKKDLRFFTTNPTADKAKVNLEILNIIKKNALVSINDIAKRSGVPDDIVANYLNSCVKKDLLKLSGSDSGEWGKFNGDGKMTLGVGFDDRNCIMSLMNFCGDIVTREEIPLKVLEGLKGRIKEFKEMITEIGRGTKLRGSDLSYIGLAIPEKMEQKNPKCKAILSEGINRLFGSEVFITKEATAAGYGEMDAGASAGKRNILYMYTDIGIGVVIKNEIIFEQNDENKEQNEAYLRPWEQFDIVNTTKSLVNKGVGTDVVKLVDGDIDSITLVTVLDAAANDDELSEDLVKRSGLALGVRVAYLVNLFGPEVVILGGGTEKKEGKFASYVSESAKRFLLNDRVGTIEIVPSILGRAASSVGAALLCRRELFMEV